MNDNIKTALILIGVVVVAAGSIAYGALTAPSSETNKPAPTSSPTNKPEEPKKLDLVEQLQAESSTIHGVLLTAHPTIKTDYTFKNEKLYGQGEWYGAQLLYKGKDKNNRDTLRVLMQKKDGVWILRTTPPQLLLSTKQFPDAPRDVLVDINKAISLQ